MGHLLSLAAARGDETLRHSPYKRLSQAIEGLEEGAVGQDKQGGKLTASSMLPGPCLLPHRKVLTR